MTSCFVMAFAGGERTIRLAFSVPVENAGHQLLLIG
jgi:hypothetical protein